MENTICFMILVVALLPDIQATSMVSISSFITTGGTYIFRCKADGNLATINFYRSDDLSPVCSITSDGSGCKEKTQSTKYKCGCIRSSIAKTSLTVSDTNQKMKHAPYIRERVRINFNKFQENKGLGGKKGDFVAESKTFTHFTIGMILNDWSTCQLYLEK
ncbi:hypothetical protein LOTGIDRAFT_165553 [Lottia gigantea]|uniref:Uncharacterized protein n=1 Tax=Lottia gigantea TaxID=225164 RepID=V4BIJ9_LOTGI|nr:hypothetical protein LOTGIDRAFT_165553 [Lottia gigantea]ESO88429.1 hypothetical protein LOTGIDRAFT_165553 [Lottia gigantea]